MSKYNFNKTDIMKILNEFYDSEIKNMETYNLYQEETFKRGYECCHGDIVNWIINYRNKKNNKQN